MERILIIGCGDIARRVIPMLTQRYRVYALVRNPGFVETLRKLGAIPLLGDLDDRISLARISGLADVVLHFAPPANPPFILPLAKGGMRGFFDIRTHNLLSMLSQRSRPARLIYISTSGVYGDCAGEQVSETRTVNASSMRGRLRVDAERQIRNWAKQCGVNASILRVPGIYAMERLPLARLHAGTPAIVADEDGYSNHIHADDLAHAVLAALRHGNPCRVYHVTDDDEMKMGDYFDAVADGYGLTRAPRLSRLEVQRAVSPMMYSFMNESRRLLNTRMKRELKVKLMYPTIADFIAQTAKPVLSNAQTSALNKVKEPD